VEILEEARSEVSTIDRKLSRREQAEIVKSFRKDIWPVCFSLLDDNAEQAAKQIWKMVRPSTAQVFKLEELNAS
jgi:hypothetical protein